MTKDELLDALALFFWNASPEGEAEVAMAAIEKGLDRYPLGFESVEEVRALFAQTVAQPE